MTVILSCGCKEDEGGSVNVRLRDTVCDAIDGYINTVIYAVYCPACAEEMRRAGALIVSDAEEAAWLGRRALEGADHE